LVRNIIGIPTASARRKSYYHARQTTRSQQHVSSRDETRRDETRRDGTRRKRVTVSTIFHVAENFPRRKGNTLSLSRRRGGTVLLKVRNKSQPSREREREEWGGEGERGGGVGTNKKRKGIKRRTRERAASRRERVLVGRSAFESRQSDAPPPGKSL
jgi:hypothetical protein